MIAIAATLDKMQAAKVLKHPGCSNHPKPVTRSKMADSDSSCGPSIRKVVLCDCCGAGFVKTHYNQKRCSKDCMSVMAKRLEQIRYAEYRKNPEFVAKVIERKRKWYIQNPTKISEYGKEYNEKNKEKRSEYAKEYQKRNASTKRLMHKLWRVKNRDRVRAYQKKLRNTDKHRQACREYSARRSKIDPVYRLVRRVRARLKMALINRSVLKTSRTFELLGMSGAEFMSYLISHPSNSDGFFTEDNFGVAWCVDHVRPISSFDILEQSQLRQAFHYSNCQPLGITENLAKGNYWEGKWWKDGRPYDYPMVEECMREIRTRDVRTA